MRETDSELCQICTSKEHPGTNLRSLNTEVTEQQKLYRHSLRQANLFCSSSSSRENKKKSDALNSQRLNRKTLLRSEENNSKFSTTCSTYQAINFYPIYINKSSPKKTKMATDFPHTNVKHFNKQMFKCHLHEGGSSSPFHRTDPNNFVHRSSTGSCLGYDLGYSNSHYRPTSNVERKHDQTEERGIKSSKNNAKKNSNIAKNLRKETQPFCSSKTNIRSQPTCPYLLDIENTLHLQSFR